MKHRFIGWIQLAEAIIEVAKRDLSKGYDIDSVKHFFKSEWYQELQGTVDLFRNRKEDISLIKEVET